MVKKNPKALVTNETLDEAVETILNGVDHIIENLVTKNEFKTELGKVDKRFDKIETDISFIKHDIRDIKEDLSLIPTREAYESLKSRVDKIAPASS